MSFYKCGHERNKIIIDSSNTLLMAAYFVWKDTTGFDGDRTQCWNCYNLNRKKTGIRFRGD